MLKIMQNISTHPMEANMRMRVVKRFFKKIAEPIIFMAYIMFTIYLSDVAKKTVNDTTGIAVIVIMIILPVLAAGVHFAWGLAKREIEHEDNQLLDKLSGNTTRY